MKSSVRSRKLCLRFQARVIPAQVRSTRCRKLTKDRACKRLYHEIYKENERPDSPDHQLFPRADSNHPSTGGVRETDRKRVCVAYSHEMVGPRGEACFEARATSDRVPPCCPCRHENDDAYKVLKDRGAPHQGRRKAKVHDHKLVCASHPGPLMERRRPNAYRIPPIIERPCGETGLYEKQLPRASRANVKERASALTA